MLQLQLVVEVVVEGVLGSDSGLVLQLRLVVEDAVEGVVWGLTKRVLARCLSFCISCARLLRGEGDNWVSLSRLLCGEGGN